MKKKGRILVVDDEEDILLSLKMFLSQHIEQVDTLNNPQRLVDILPKTPYDIIILDMNFRKGDTSGKEGLQWLKRCKQIQPLAGIIVITAYADVKNAVEAVKLGAVDFLEKPWRNERLLTTILGAFKLVESKKELRKLKQSQAAYKQMAEQGFGDIIGNSPPLQRIFTLIDKVAKTDADVLILGENGTGKELIARSIHRNSLRKEEVFVNVDLGAIPESLFESELFGHKKGAFTDAKHDRVGHFESASGGTLFLDEIGNLSPRLQAKLLTALQNREVRRLGSTEAIPIDIRLICATNMPLNEMVKDKSFRQDLLYRINTVEIKLPPLRERISDIPLLSQHFLEIYSKKYNKPKLNIKTQALQMLESYHWPGNIRELRHAIERAVILCEETFLSVQDFVFQHAEGQEGDPELDSYNLDDIEKWAIRKAMTKHQGNISQAAKELGLTRAALYRRLAKHGL